MTQSHAPHPPRGVRPPLALGRRRNRRRPSGPGIFKRFGMAVKKLFPYVLVTLLVVGLGGGGYVAWQRIVQLPALTVQGVDVRPGERTTEQEILTAADAKHGAPILKLDLDGIVHRVRALPWVQSVTVRRQLPDTLNIEVVDHSPMLLVALERLYIADADGALFKTFDAHDALDLPVLTGLTGDPNMPPGSHAGDTVRAGLALAAGVDAHRLELGELQELHFDEDLGWTLTVLPPTVGSPVTVHLGTEPLARLALALSTLRELDQRRETPEVIWADAAKSPDRVQVQLKEEKTPTRGSHGTEG